MTIFTDLSQIWTDYTFRTVATGATILGISTGALGGFAYLRKQSLLADTIAHGSLSGVVLAFLLFQTKKLEILLLGGAITGLLACFSLSFLKNKSKISYDSSLSIILSTFFGMGMILLTYTQKLPTAAQSGLNQFIYGQASALLKEDIEKITYFTLFLFLSLLCFWKPCKLSTFDPEFSHILHLKPKFYQNYLTFSLILVILLGLQTVGVILISGMLVAPAMASRPWVKSLESMTLLSGSFGGISAFLGTYFSTLWGGLPTGPVIVVTMTTLVFLSLSIHFCKEKLMFYIQSKEKTTQELSTPKKLSESLIN